MTEKRPDESQRAPEQLIAEFGRRVAARDPEGAAALFAQPNVVRDRRSTVSTGEVAGPEMIASMLTASPDVRMEVDEVLACDDRVVAAVVTWRGHSVDRGGGYEVRHGWVAVVEDGLGRSSDLYDAGDRTGLVARYTELGGGLSALGDSPLEQLQAEWSLRYTRRDMDGLLKLVSEEYELIDHRLLAWEPVRGHAGFRPMMESGWNTSADLRREVDEVLAVADDVIALRIAIVGRSNADIGGGEFRFEFCHVVRFADGRAEHVDQFGPEDREAVLARFAELGGRLDR